MKCYTDERDHCHNPSACGNAGRCIYREALLNIPIDLKDEYPLTSISFTQDNKEVGRIENISMSSPLPYLLEQIKSHLGLSKDIERHVKATRKKYASETTEVLESILEAHDQYMVTHLQKSVEIQVENIVIKDLLKVRKGLKNASKP